MGSIPHPGDSDPGDLTQPLSNSPSFDEFQKQTSLMTTCTLLWKELSDHFTFLEQNLQTKTQTLNSKLQTLNTQTKQSLQTLAHRETSIHNSIEVMLKKLEENQTQALNSHNNDVAEPEVDDSEGLVMKLKSFCLKMDSLGFWEFVSVRKKEIDLMREKMAVVLEDCVDPARFVLEAISEVFPVDKREKITSDLGWACVLLLESLVPVMVDPVMGKDRMLVTPKVREKAQEIAGLWKKSRLEEEKGGIENVKAPDVHTFLQHLVTFGIEKREDLELYRKLVIGSAWRKQMPNLAVSLGLGDKMADIIEELISRGQQVDAVHFTYEVGLVDKFPPVPLLKAFLMDARKASSSEDANNAGRAAHLAAKKEQSALRSVIKCIEDYKLEADFPPENMKKRLELLEKAKSEKKRPAAVPANKRTRASNGGPMPPAKAGRSTNAYVSSFPAAPTFVNSPSPTHYPAGVPPYLSPPAIYGHGSRSPISPYAYSPEASVPAVGSYPGTPPMNYPAYGGYVNGMTPAYHQAYYR